LKYAQHIRNDAFGGKSRGESACLILEVAHLYSKLISAKFGCKSQVLTVELSTDTKATITGNTVQYIIEIIHRVDDSYSVEIGYEYSSPLVPQPTL
jgi:hypothetical protein